MDEGGSWASRQVILFGPTGSGKSALALRLAATLGLEIVGVDAFQVYRGMDIGTAKPSWEERRRVRHHLIDVAEVTESFTAGRYLHLAEQVVKDLEARKQDAVWVGGTGLYLRVLREGLAAAPATDANLRRELERVPLGELQAEVKRVDPAWAAQADLKNPARVLRAVAVWRQTGRPLSVWQAEGRPGPLAGSRLLALAPSREVLRRRVEHRFEKMWAEGWTEEVRGLLGIPGWEESGAARAIGYNAVAAVVRGQLSQEECRTRVVAETMSYVKRQLTWLKRQDNLRIVKSDGSQVDFSALVAWWKAGRGDCLA